MPHPTPIGSRTDRDCRRWCGIERQPVLQRRKRPAAAVRPVAQPAGEPDARPPRAPGRCRRRRPPPPACAMSQPIATMRTAGGSPQRETGADHGAGEAEECGAVRQLRHLHHAPAPGVASATCTTQRGHEPPKRANGKPAAENRLDTLPAGSTRTKKNGTPRSPGRCNEDSRWQACSKLTPKRAASASMSWRSSRAAAANGGVGHQQRRGEVVEQPDAQQPGRLRRARRHLGQQRLHRLARLQQGELEGEMEATALARQQLRQRQAAGRRIVAAQRTRQRTDGDGDARAAGAGARRWHGSAPDGRAASSALSASAAASSGGEMVGTVAEDIAHFLGGQQDAPPGRQRDAAGILARHPPGAVQRQHRPGGGRAAAGQGGDFGIRHRLGAEQRVGEHLAQLRLQLPLGGCRTARRDRSPASRRA